MYEVISFGSMCTHADSTSVFIHYFYYFTTMALWMCRISVYDRVLFAQCIFPFFFFNAIYVYLCIIQFLFHYFVVRSWYTYRCCGYHDEINNIDLYSNGLIEELIKKIKWRTIVYLFYSHLYFYKTMDWKYKN